MAENKMPARSLIKVKKVASPVRSKAKKPLKTKTTVGIPVTKKKVYTSSY